MLTSASACLWILLFWLVASDSELPWNSQKRRPATKNGSDAQGRMKAKTDTLGSYGRIAAYAALAVLFWSWSSPSSFPSYHDAGAVHPEEPPFKFRVEPASLPSDEEQPGSPVHHTHHQDTSDDMFHQAINNETLGFNKIFVVNLPERTDKRDALSLVGALTDIKLTWTSAIRGTSVPDKALPLGVDRAGWRDGGIGSWRSQINIIRTMVEENIPSALILEDDADWDVRIKEQLVAISQGTRILLDRAHEEEAFAASLTHKQRQVDQINSPYGHGWDILWLGHCGETFPERIPGHHEIYDPSSTRYTYYAMRDDETLPAEPAAVTESWIAGDLARERGTRWVHFSGGPTCSQAYALSQSGARKVLLALSVGGTLIEQLDNAMSKLCRDHTPWDRDGGGGGAGAAEGEDDDHRPGPRDPPGYPGAGMRCLSVNPAVFSQHKPRGRRAAESDIETVEDGEGFREVGESPNLVWSARLNVQNLMMGRPMQEQRVPVGQTEEK